MACHCSSSICVDYLHPSQLFSVMSGQFSVSLSSTRGCVLLEDTTLCLRGVLNLSVNQLFAFKHLILNHSNFTGMIFGWSSFQAKFCPWHINFISNRNLTKLADNKDMYKILIKFEVWQYCAICLKSYLSLSAKNSNIWPCSRHSWFMFSFIIKFIHIAKK